ncbi:MAG: Glycoside hydrolase family 5, partial [Parcubacteria group bacterium GW2011_GWB1_45_9]
MIDIEFIANQQLTNAELFIAPEIRQFIKVLTPLNNQINSGERTQIKLLLQILATQSIGELEGSIHVRMRNRTVAKPLPVSIRIISADTLTNKVSDFLVKEFGTVLPNLDPDERFLYIPEIPPELVELTGEGTGLPVVFRIGSIIFSSNLSPVFDLEMRGIELIDALDSRGINISILEAALPSIVWNEDIPEKSVIPSNTQAITIFPPFAMFDTDGNFVPDTIVIIPDNTIHIVLKPQDVQDLLANPPIQPGGILTPAGSTALHELIHVHNFQTKCGDAWFNLLQEESFVQKVELLIADVIFGRDTQILTNSAVFVIQQFSRGIDCFEALDLTPPTSVTLNLLTNISTSTVSLSWSQNTDPDFASYKLLRSTSPNVTTNNTLIATITNQNQTSFTDANLSSGTTFFYKLFVFDKAGLSTGSNEVSSATISVPRVPLCPL